MKKKLSLLVTIIAFGLWGFAQETTFIMNFEETVFSGTTGQSIVFEGTVENLTGEEIEVEVSLHNPQIPEDWILAYCDPEICHTPGSLYGSFTVPAASTSPISVDVKVGNTPGSAEVDFVIYDKDAPAITDTTALKVDMISGIEETFKETLSVFPNPNNGNFYIHSPENIAEDLQCNLFDLSGKMIHSFSLAGEELKAGKPISIDHFSGAAILQLKSRSFILKKRLVIY